MKIHYTLEQFPATPALQSDSALPFGFTLQPFANHEHTPLKRVPRVHVDNLPRCSECGGYINCFVSADLTGWRCSICGSYNEYVRNESRRYSRSSTRDQCSELQHQLFEVLCPASQEVYEGYAALSGALPPPRDGLPVFIALVDVSAGPEFVELVKMSLSSAIAALPMHTLAGIITVSDEIGLWDCKGSIPVVRNVAVFDDGAVMLPLEDAMPLRSLLAPISDCAAQLNVAVEALKPSRNGKLALGAALHAVMDYLGGLGAPVPDVRGAKDSMHAAEATYRLGPARLCLFLGSAPNLGPGSTVPGTGTDAENHAPSSPAPAPARSPAVQLSSIPFYEQLAVVAAMLGISVDIYAAGPASIGLAALAPLCQKSGGMCYHYASLESAAIPQDLCWRLGTPQALGGLLRIRTCPELRIARSYGRVLEDPDHDNLYHIVVADVNDTLAFDLELANMSGFVPVSGSRAPHPVIQVAFQYSILIYRKMEKVDEAGNTHEVKVYELQRRMRVLTVAPSPTRSHTTLYSNVRMAPVITILLHKVLNDASKNGCADARQLLQEWIVLFLARYHSHMGNLPRGAAPQPGHIDVTLASSDRLSALAVYIYALLRSPLLASASESSSDAAVYLRTLWTTLTPSELMQAIYPTLVGFDDPETRSKRSRFPLSRAALQSGDIPLLVMDAFHLVVVMCRSRAGAGSEAGFAFPPPQSCMLRQAIQNLRQDRRIVPQVKYCREGDPDSALLGEMLVDEPVLGASTEEPANEAATLGYSSWLDFIQNEVLKTLASDA